MRYYTGDILTKSSSFTPVSILQIKLQFEQLNIDKSGIRIKPGDIFKLLGDQKTPVDDHTSDMVNHYITKSLEQSSPAGAFVLADAVETKSVQEIALPGLTFRSGNIIRKMLRNAEHYALFLVTAGPEPENLAKRLMEKGDYLEAYITDLVASSLVESVADLVQEQVRSLASSRGMFITNRYSPGYCSWNVAEQQKLFTLFPEGTCGISLSASSLMDPVKSASGIIGMGRNVKFNDYTCEICPMNNCMFRKLKNHL